MVCAGYHLHPAVLDAALHAARLASAATVGLELMPQRQHLVSLSSFAPAAGSSPGSSSSSSGSLGARSQQAVTSSFDGRSAATASLLAAANGSGTAQFSGLLYAAGALQTGSNAGAAALQLVDAAGCSHIYQTVWLADHPEAADCPWQASSSSQAALSAVRQHHHISFDSPGAPSRRLQLEAVQPPSVVATALLAALQQSAANRDTQVGCAPDAHDCVLFWWCCEA